MDRVLMELKRSTEHSSHSVVYLTRVPDNAPAPNSEVRKYISANMPTILEACSSYHVVMEGTGFLAAFKRGVLTNILQPVWKKKLFHVHAQIDEVHQVLSPQERQAVARVLRKAEDLGLLTCRAPGEAPLRAQSSTRD